MDRLNELLETAGPLLRRVDATIAGAGAPPSDEVWTQLRRVRLLPGDAVRAVAALRPADLADAAPELRADARAYAVLAGSLPAPGEWSGIAAEAYDRVRARTATHLSGDRDSLDERLQASADLADDLITWMRQTREAVAAVLGDILGSLEAVVLAGDKVDISAPREVSAAATVAERVLRTVADAYDRAADLLSTSAALAESATTMR
ncbi:hypothetical protein COUCH_37620 [Couchioplanes caeruleus]|uniref:hypothetical protein n=1 Tax=Couchioplanes caeruleus TaxID=56438 RepID=UPI0020BFCF15|nr:hypothetical protein [Couchioplanes caeruleus]UQU64603.1 hypothetical protein COUCH_37620 [Couchioplanes caeruleus]